MNDDWAIDFEYDENNRIHRYYVDKEGNEFIARMIPYGTEVNFKDTSGNIICDKVTMDLYLVTDKQGISTLKTIMEFQLNFSEGKRSDYVLELDSLVIKSISRSNNDFYNFSDINLVGNDAKVVITATDSNKFIDGMFMKKIPYGRKFKLILTPFE